jgi:N6-adenosine-specific RNA methylase IME4
MSEVSVRANPGTLPDLPRQTRHRSDADARTASGCPRPHPQACPLLDTETKAPLVNDLIVAERQNVKLDQARRLLAEVHDAPSAKHVADLAAAAVLYAKRAKLGEEHIRYAAAIKVDAERLLGLFLKAAPKAKGGQPYQATGTSKAPVAVRRLADLGLTKKESSRSQFLADLPARTFEKVKAGELTVVEAKRQAKERERETRRDVNRAKVGSVAPLAEAARFATILIDPPWDFREEGDDDVYGRTRPTYAQMSDDAIAALPIGRLADTDCHLYLWITNRSLLTGKGWRLCEGWGFRPITIVTWCKPSIGVGNYFRNNTEHLVFAVKGSQPLNRKNVGTWFEAPRGPDGHSSKPNEAYSLIESCSPGPYLELFARSCRDGWSMWGADADAA